MKIKYIIAILTAFLSLKCLAQDIPVINILDAIDKKTIDYKASGRYNTDDKTEYIDADGQYYGKSMLIILHNNSDDTLYIYIPEGLMLMSEDTVIQDMLITKPVYALLKPKRTQTYPLYAMCSEIHDKVPATHTKYTISKNNDEKLVSIAQTINRSFMQNVIGQGAVWAYTDNATEEDLRTYGARDETLELTLNLLAKAGIKTKLAEELNFVPPTIIEANKDSIIHSLSNDLDYANTVLKYKKENIELNPIAFYSGIGVIILIIGATTYLAFRKRKNKNDLT
jgi:hypothetical protein